MNVDVTQHELDRYPTFTFTLGNGNGIESKVLLYKKVYLVKIDRVSQYKTIETEQMAIFSTALSVGSWVNPIF